MANNEELNNVAEGIMENAAAEAKKSLTVVDGDMVELKLSPKSYAFIGLASAAGVVAVCAAKEAGKKVIHWVSGKIEKAKEKRAAKKAMNLQTGKEVDVEVIKK